MPRRVENSKSVFNASPSKPLDLLHKDFPKTQSHSSQSLNLRGYSPLKQQMMEDPTVTQRTIMNNPIVSQALQVNKFMPDKEGVSIRYQYVRNPEDVVAYEILNADEFRKHFKLDTQRELIKMWLKREISFKEFQRRLNDAKMYPARIEEQMDLDNHYLDKQNDVLYQNEKIAIRNWKKVLLQIRSCYAILKALTKKEFQIQIDNYEEEIVDPPVPWYESGKWTIYPNTYKFAVWELAKSTLYMASMYTFAYMTAFMFQTITTSLPQEEFEWIVKFDMFVDVLQLVDMVLTFFTAVHVRNLSTWVKKKRHS